jgi:hypothetical protein
LFSSKQELYLLEIYSYNKKTFNAGIEMISIDFLETMVGNEYLQENKVEMLTKIKVDSFQQAIANKIVSLNENMDYSSDFASKRCLN